MFVLSLKKKQYFNRFIYNGKSFLTQTFYIYFSVFNFNICNKFYKHFSNRKNILFYLFLLAALKFKKKICNGCKNKNDKTTAPWWKCLSILYLDWISRNSGRHALPISLLFGLWKTFCWSNTLVACELKNSTKLDKCWMDKWAAWCQEAFSKNYVWTVGIKKRIKNPISFHSQSGRKILEIWILLMFYFLQT
jgi:hypothetical protein